jgi:hypothetical protein
MQTPFLWQGCTSHLLARFHNQKRVELQYHADHTHGYEAMVKWLDINVERILATEQTAGKTSTPAAIQAHFRSEFFI